MARLSQGEALIELHQTAQGLALIDEVMVSVTSDEMSSVVASPTAGVIDWCQRVFDQRSL